MHEVNQNSLKVFIEFISPVLEKIKYIAQQIAKNDADNLKQWKKKKRKKKKPKTTAATPKETKKPDM